MTNTDDLLKCAIKTAKAAGRHALDNRARRNETIQTTPHDVKLALDVECQEVAESIIRSTFPDHCVLGEESDKTQGAEPSTDDSQQPSSYRWIVDPIDGTVNFSHGFIFWCCSVAVQHDGETVAAAVYAPCLNELFTASADEPAALNGEPVNVSKVANIKDAMILTGMDRKVVPGHEPYQTFRTIADNVQKARITGSAALDLCRVACGQAEGYFESDIYIWDVAAAGFIIQRAGGNAEVVKELELPHQMQYIAANGLIDKDFKALLNI